MASYGLEVSKVLRFTVFGGARCRFDLLGGLLGDLWGTLGVSWSIRRRKVIFVPICSIFGSKPLVFVRDGEFDGENAMGF